MYRSSKLSVGASSLLFFLDSLISATLGLKPETEPAPSDFETEPDESPAAISLLSLRRLIVCNSLLISPLATSHRELRTKIAMDAYFGPGSPFCQESEIAIIISHNDARAGLSRSSMVPALGRYVPSMAAVHKTTTNPVSNSGRDSELGNKLEASFPDRKIRKGNVISPIANV